MLTVKHIAPNGTEVVVSCDRFVREKRKDGFVQFTAFGEHSVSNDYVASWCGDQHALRVEAACGLTERHVIFVMNKFGSTVASYTFIDPDFSLTADSEKLAA